MKKGHIFILFACLTVILSCIKNKTSIEEPAIDNFEQFSVFGDVHNMMLEYTENNLDLSVNCTSLDDGLDYLIKIQTEAIDKSTLPIADKKLIKRMLPEQRKLYLKKNINDGLLTKGEENPEAFTIDEITKLVNNSYASGLLDEFERESLLRLIDMSVESAKGELEADVFNDNIEEMVSQWKSLYADVDYSGLFEDCSESCNIPHGALSAVVLNIAISSLGYWEEETHTKALGVVGTIAVQDIVGAVIGGVSGAVGSAVISDDVNWKSVAWGAGVGAITGSTGVVGKVSRFIASLF